ncbi:hypothetical protein [Actinoplanes palleronii]|uniref:Transmembrane protein n=1 Tax=Actinoplanes palleronii TaxID=113570 RepID=A0ABQ4B729_9ACTN|nr:hypothetical protein [Actinoplanes palleronii]GIE66478.1 hypothetical protein Apa02nite_025860 [Actinoplanes palleronii]
MNSGVDEAKLMLKRLVGKFAFFFAVIYFLLAFAGVVRLAQGDHVPLSTWLLLIPAGVVFVLAVIDGINLHRFSDSDRLGKLWRRCGILTVSGVVLLVLAVLLVGGIDS